VDTYDYIIAGGGCAGLSLAYRLSQSALKDSRVLIIDSDDKQQNDRTWCFWGTNNVPFHSVVSHSWPALSFIDDNDVYTDSLGDQAYHLIRGIDFYNFVLRAIEPLPNFHFVKGTITRLSSDSVRGAVMLGDGKRFNSKWVFNSCIRTPTHQGSNKHFLWQDFKGWWVRTKQPSFDTDRAVLMDFRAAQKADTRFYYLLPLSETEALIEYTAFTRNRLGEEECNTALEHYLKNVLSISQYDIMEEERAAIPMTDYSIPAQHSERVVNIGGVGGAIKPSTGYAFLNIQEQVEQIVAQLIRGEQPDAQLRKPARFAFYDSLLLHILQYRGKQGKLIFSQLFRRNSMRSILQFLAERSPWWKEAGIFASLPIGVFVSALADWKVAQAKSYLLPALRKVPVQNVKSRL